MLKHSENSTKAYGKVCDIPARISMAEKLCVNAATVLKNQLKDLTNRLIDIESSRPVESVAKARYPVQTNTTGESVDDRDPSSIWKAVKKTNKKLTLVIGGVMSLKTRGDSNVVRFGGLGFQSVSDAGVWLETHATSEGYGWVYDNHTLMQAGNINFSGKDLIKRLSKCYKLEIEDGLQAATIASFETAIPRCFCANATQ